MGNKKLECEQSREHADKLAKATAMLQEALQSVHDLSRQQQQEAAKVEISEDEYQHDIMDGVTKTGETVAQKVLDGQQAMSLVQAMPSAGSKGGKGVGKSEDDSKFEPYAAGKAAGGNQLG